MGFVGLGVMGAPMAGHLLDRGHPLTVWNRTAAKAEELVTRGARQASTLEELAEECPLIFLCVGRTEDVEECLTPMLKKAQPGPLFVDHSTISPEGARRIHRQVREAGGRFVDAPITGGSMGAIKGTLTIFCGGDEEDIERARTAMDSYAKRIARVGGPGAGQTMKAANQIAVALALLGLCESLAFAEKAGLDLTLTRELLAGGAAGSWAFDNYGPKILNRDWSPGFSINNQLKDLAYCREAAETVGATLLGTELTENLLARLQESGRGAEATCALFDLLAEEGIS